MPENAEEDEDFLKLVHNVLLEVTTSECTNQCCRFSTKNQWLTRLMCNKVKWCVPTALMFTRLEMVFPTCCWQSMKSKIQKRQNNTTLYYITSNKAHFLETKWRGIIRCLFIQYIKWGGGRTVTSGWSLCRLASNYQWTSSSSWLSLRRYPLEPKRWWLPIYEQWK